MHVPVDLLEACSWSRHFREDIIKVVELSQMDDGHNILMLILGENHHEGGQTQLQSKQRGPQPETEKWVELKEECERKRSEHLSTEAAR